MARSRYRRVLSVISRHSIVRVAGVYLVAAWLCIQVTLALEASLGLPEWVDTLTLVGLAVGFPVACVIAWASDLRPSTATSAQASESRPGLARRWVDYAALGGLSVVLVLAAIPHLEGAFSSISPRSDERTSVAVLPFHPVAGSEEGQRFGEGLTIEIINALAQRSDLRIPGRSSASECAAKPQDLRSIGEGLNVDYILEGTVRRVDDRLRVEAQLADAANGFLVWSGIYDDQIRNTFMIQDDIADAIGEAMGQPLTGGAPAELS